MRLVFKVLDGSQCIRVIKVSPVLSRARRYGSTGSRFLSRNEIFFPKMTYLLMFDIISGVSFQYWYNLCVKNSLGNYVLVIHLLTFISSF